MTPQEIFTRVWNHMAMQRVKSVGTDACMYRGPNGTACAVGCLLDDDLAIKLDGLEFLGIKEICARNPQMVPDWVHKNRELLIKLQDAHDDPFDSGTWYSNFCERMRVIARDFKLQVPE